MAKPDDIACRGIPSKAPTYEVSADQDPFSLMDLKRLKTVSFTLEAKITEDEYLAATFGALGMFLAAYLFVFLISCVVCIRKIRYPEQAVLDQPNLNYSSIEEAPNKVLDEAIVDLEQQIRRHEAEEEEQLENDDRKPVCLLYTSPSPRDS